MRVLCCSALFAVFTASVARPGAGDDAQAKELRALAGYWAVDIKEEEKGLVTPSENDGRLSIIIHIRPDGTLDIRGPRPGTAILNGKVTVHPARKPRAMDIEILSGRHKGKKQYAIYELKMGKTRAYDRLVVVVADLGRKRADLPPDTGTTKANTTRYVFGRVFFKTIE